MVTALALLALLQSSALPEHVRGAADLVKLGRFTEALKQLDGLDPKLAGVQHLRGVAFYNLREYSKASEALRAGIAVERPGSAAFQESALLIGQSEFVTNHWAEAIPWLEKARASGPVKPEILYMLGISRVHLQHPADAIKAFASLFEVPPESAAALLVTAHMMFRLEQLKEAESLLRKALELDPKLSGAHQLLGEIGTSRNDSEAAVRDLKAELLSAPNSSAAWYKLGDAYSRSEDWANAIPALQRSVWLSPYNSGPFILLGKGYLKRGELSNAEGMLRRALQIDPGNASARYILGQTLLKLGRSEEGREMLKKSRNSGEANR